MPLVTVRWWPIGSGRHGENGDRTAVGGADSILDHAHLPGTGENDFSVLEANKRSGGHRVDVRES